MDFAGALSVASIVLSLLFVARQTRDLARQTKINNSIASVGLVHDILELSHTWHSGLIEKPHLRPYFFGSRACGSSNPDRVVTETMAEMLADLLDYNLTVTKLMPEAGFSADWHRWPRHMLLRSPILREVVQGHRDWWPALAALYTQTIPDDLPSGGAPADEAVRDLPHPLLIPRSRRGRWRRRLPWPAPE